MEFNTILMLSTSLGMMITGLCLVGYLIFHKPTKSKHQCKLEAALKLSESKSQLLRYVVNNPI